jgi:eukaryotic-like serine/threonine-protein kinase
LQAAHAVGIVHRDVKPGNVLITPQGGVKLTDFGIATVQGDPTLTGRGLVMGSPAYMAPEQALGDRVTAAADAWGLGATLFFAVEGVAPLRRGGMAPMQRAGPLAPVIEAALVHDPRGRASLAKLRALLEPVAAADSYGPVQTGPYEEPDSRGLRDIAGRAAKDLAPAVASLLAQHEARYPALRRLRTALDDSGDERPPEPEPPAPKRAPAPLSEAFGGMGQRLRRLWRAAKLVLAVLVAGILALIGYVAYYFFG